MNPATLDVFFAIVILILFSTSRVLTNAISGLKSVQQAEDPESFNDLILYRKGVSAAFTSAIAMYAIYHLSIYYKVESHVMEWLNLLVRWAHVVLGIAWIGASFYFIFLENSLNRTEGLRDELAGNLWAIHGGGFYYVEKYKGAPTALPKHLHWFKYEAYFTWLTGFILLVIVYFMNAKALMIDKSVKDISEGSAILLGLGTLISG